MTTRIAFTARIRTGQRDRLAAMLAEGPPFDPSAAGFTRHWVYLGDDDVVFVFEGPDPLTAVRRLSAERELLRKTVRMAGLVHAPHFLGEVYAWEAAAGTADA